MNAAESMQLEACHLADLRNGEVLKGAIAYRINHLELCIRFNEIEAKDLRQALDDFHEDGSISALDEFIYFDGNWTTKNMAVYLQQELYECERTIAYCQELLNDLHGF